MGPTAYDDLNAVLAAFVDGVTDALGANFAGAYLVGSFALGAADEYSDVDFIVVTEEDLSDVELARLQALHARLYALHVPWAQHLEGSYIPRARLEHVDPERRPFLFLDNGSRELEPDNHCNTAVTRLVLRSHGITLAGPAPATLVAPVAAADLRREALRAAQEYAEWASAGPMSRWKQPYLVLTLCRILASLDTGDVLSKRRAGAWAIAALAPEWSGLIERALADRPDPWGRVNRPAEPALAARTLAFATYAAETTKGPLRGPSVQ